MSSRFRWLTRQPGLALATLLSLCLGIAGATLITTVLDRVILAPLPYDDAEQLVEIWDSWEGTTRAPLTAPEFFVLRDEAKSFDSVAAFVHDQIVLVEESGPVEVLGLAASAQIFEVLGVDAQVGRVFSSAEDQPGAAGVVVLSHDFWKRRYDGNPAIVSSVLVCDGQPRVIVGVLPEHARMPRTHAAAQRADLWIPAQLQPEFNIHYFSVMARLRRDTERTRASQETHELALEMQRRFPEKGVRSRSMEVFPVKEEVLGSTRSLTPLLFLSACLLLLLSLTNSTALWWARFEAQRDALVIRSHLGASRRRLLLDLGSETLAISLASLTLAIPLVHLGIAGLRFIDPGSIPRLHAVRFGLEQLRFPLVFLSIAMGALFLLPASRTIGTLPDQTRNPTSSSARGRHRALTVIEASAAAALLVSAALLVRSASNLARVELGFDPSHIHTVELRLPNSTYDTPTKRRQFFAELETHLASSPHVVAAGLTQRLPLDSEHRGGPARSLTIEGREEPAELGATGLTIISPGYLSIVGLQVAEGRGFRPSDTDSTLSVMLVNETMARTYWPQGSPVGTRVDVLKPVRDGSGSQKVSLYEEPATVVGVIEDRPMTLDQPVSAMAFLPHAQRGLGAMKVLVESRSSPALVNAELRRLIRELEPDLPVGPVVSMQSRRREALATPRFLAWSIVLFAGLVVVLCALGVHASVKFRAQAGRHELAIRCALGADPRQLLSWLTLECLFMVMFGVVPGLALGAGTGALLGSNLHDVPPLDPPTLLLTTALLVSVALISALPPAIRALGQSPSRVLQSVD